MTNGLEVKQVSELGRVLRFGRAVSARTRAENIASTQIKSTHLSTFRQYLANVSQFHPGLPRRARAMHTDR